ncbi:MAG: class III lanthionine synthetase LanKC [Mycobacteriales bacterium]
MNVIEFTLADQDFCVPIDQWAAGVPYAPSRPVPGWVRREGGLWAHWSPPAGPPLPDQGWKVHVSARFDRTQQVLDAVTDLCGRHGVPYKHVRTDRLFLWLHHKHGPRVQSGKFCALYPAGVDAARALMEALAAALDGERGPYVLTDRRFGSSGVVSYRYGAFTPRFQLTADGGRIPIVAGPDGRDLPDERLPRFSLPDGITDPFAPVAEAGAAAPEPGPVSLHGYTFTRVLQFSNAGGAYRATAADGRAVFVKEARADNGYQWDGSAAQERLRRERDTLRALHAAVPGICPEPLDHFREWEHEFLVTELVPGIPLLSWMSRHNPVTFTDPDAAAYTAYHDRCRALLGALRDQLDRLHAAGYAFVDLNPRNVLVDSDDRPRLIDFEEARPVGGERRRVHGAEDYLPAEARDPARFDSMAIEYFDSYALAALAQLLLHPLHPVLNRNPDAAAHLAADLPAVPADLWRAAGRYRQQAGPGLLPAPEDVAAAPRQWLGWLHDRIVAGLESMADPAADRPYPLGPHGFASHRHNLAYGTAGVVRALHRAGVPVHPRVVGQLLDAAITDRDALPPGLFTGTAGLAWTLADLGQLDAARDLLADADRHPLATGGDVTLAHGTAGIALTHLALYRHDGDTGHLDRAADLLAGLPSGPELVAGLGPDDSTGWRVGRPGIALALYYLARLTGDRDALRRGRALLLDDLDQAVEDPAGLQFRVSRKDQRAEPYLATGSAGFALVAGRYLGNPGGAPGGDGDGTDPLAAAYRRCLTTVRTILLPVLPALFDGLSGLGLVLADLAATTGDESLHAAAVRSGRALFKYAVPRSGGICFLGLGNRFSADLAYGSAGVLLFLDELLHGRRDALFTLDADPVRERTPQRSPGHPGHHPTGGGLPARRPTEGVTA